jgi:hypothetical protein
MDILKYNCESCKFCTNSLTAWEKHEETGKHKSGGIKRKIRRDKKEELVTCQFCDYEHKRYHCVKSHILNNHSTKEHRKKEYKYYCDKCDFGTFSNQRYDEHLICQNHVNK